MVEVNTSTIGFYRRGAERQREQRFRNDLALLPTTSSLGDFFFPAFYAGSELFCYFGSGLKFVYQQIVKQLRLLGGELGNLVFEIVDGHDAENLALNIP